MELDFWKNKKVLVTGHTGFKGSWLTLWLQMLGARVIGYSLRPTSRYNMYDLASISDGTTSVIGDIRDRVKLDNCIQEHQPEIIFHLAAQPLVLQSYRDPVETFATNVMGTVNILEAARQTDSVKVIINVTSDKAYENKEWIWSYRENEQMGGHDPYSASKGCSELITSAYRNSFFGDNRIAIATARAGNVIGGGDWSENRIIPDILRAITEQLPLQLRNPHAIRPWQHVIDPIHGYLLLASLAWENSEYAQAWNFGPPDNQTFTVQQLIQQFSLHLGQEPSVIADRDVSQFHEATYLKLDSSKAKQYLGWRTMLSLDESIKWTCEWYKAWIEGKDLRKLSLDQIRRFQKIICVT